MTHFSLPSPVAVAVAVIVTILPGTLATGSAATAAAPIVVQAVVSVTAAQAVTALPVKGRAPLTGYTRAQFGQVWADTDRNGCDTRNDVLRRDLRPYELKVGTYGCLVLRGTLLDPYTTKTLAFVRGPQSAQVQVDHVVALADAWVKGAKGWPAAKRVAFANDSLNLLAVDGPTNLRKGAGDAATWLPPARGYRCRYVARQASVKRKYGLSVTAAERAAMLGVLKGCWTQPLAVGTVFRLGGGTTAAPAPAAAPVPAPAPAPVPVPAPVPAPPPAVGVSYANCTAVRAAGAAPIRPGDPGWDPKFDGDGDGVGCE